MSGHNPNQTPEQPGSSGLTGQAGLTGTGAHVTPGSGTAGNILRKWDHINIIFRIKKFEYKKFCTKFKGSKA